MRRHRTRPLSLSLRDANTGLKEASSGPNDESVQSADYLEVRAIGVIERNRVACHGGIVGREGELGQVVLGGVENQRGILLTLAKLMAVLLSGGLLNWKSWRRIGPGMSDDPLGRLALRPPRLSWPHAS